MCCLRTLGSRQLYHHPHVPTAGDQPPCSLSACLTSATPQPLRSHILLPHGEALRAWTVGLREECFQACFWKVHHQGPPRVPGRSLPHPQRGCQRIPRSCPRLCLAPHLHPVVQFPFWSPVPVKTNFRVLAEELHGACMSSLSAKRPQRAQGPNSRALSLSSTEALGHGN